MEYPYGIVDFEDLESKIFRDDPIEWSSYQQLTDDDYMLSPTFGEVAFPPLNIHNAEDQRLATDAVPYHHHLSNISAGDEELQNSGAVNVNKGDVQFSEWEIAGPPDELPKVMFFEWLESNRDCISLADLRSIKLKRSTIENATKHLGGGKKGMLYLLKLILIWLQNHHLQQKRLYVHDESESRTTCGNQNSAVAPRQTDLQYPFHAAKYRRLNTSVGLDPLTCNTNNIVLPIEDLPVKYCSTPSATTRAARKSRMARQKRSSISDNHNHRVSSSHTALINGHHLCPSGIGVPAPAAAGWKECNSVKNLKLLLRKELKQSDVGNLGRIVLPKKEAETHLPELEARDGIPIVMEDIVTSRAWHMRYRFWPNNKSRMYLLENTGEFVKSNGLREGDFILIYSDAKTGKYMIRGVKVLQAQPGAIPSGNSNIQCSNGETVMPPLVSCNGHGLRHPAISCRN